jgi:serine/threonine protein kinase
MENLIGQSIGRYHILEQLGEGGMAIVYKAYDTRLECDVAVKFIRTEKLNGENAEKVLKRFKTEAQKTAALMHPNIIPVIDYGDYEGMPYLVMKYLPGGTLKKVLDHRLKNHAEPFPYQQAAALLAPIARALELAHQNGIVHRDIKPSNILLTQNWQPMLTDFGVAKIIEADVTMDETGLGVGIGTPQYMAPEQWEGESIDARTDVYSLGVVFYEMITAGTLQSRYGCRNLGQSDA